MFLIIIGGTIITFLIIQWIKIKKKPKIETVTRVINLIPEWSHGHSEGWLTEQKRTPSGVTRIEFYPTDLSKKERFEGKLILETIIAKNVQTIPIGKLSSNTNTLWIFPNTLDELIKKLPYLEVKLPLFEDREKIRKEIERIFKKELPEKVNELKLIIEEFNKEKNKKIEGLEIYGKPEDYNEKINKLSDGINLLALGINNAIERYIQIPTKELFDHNVISNNFMFEMGKGTTSGYLASLESVKKLNFGAMSQLERQKLMEKIEDIKHYFLARPREEKERM